MYIGIDVCTYVIILASLQTKHFDGETSFFRVDDSWSVILNEGRTAERQFCQKQFMDLFEFYSCDHKQKTFLLQTARPVDRLQKYFDVTIQMLKVWGIKEKYCPLLYWFKNQSKWFISE